MIAVVNLNPDFGYQISGIEFRFPFSDFGFRGLGFGYQNPVFGFRFPVFDVRFPFFGFRVSGFVFPSLGFGLRVHPMRPKAHQKHAYPLYQLAGGVVAAITFWRILGFGSPLSGFEVQVSGFGSRVSGFEVRGSGFGVRGSGFEVRGSGFGVMMLSVAGITWWSVRGYSTIDYGSSIASLQRAWSRLARASEPRPRAPMFGG